MFNNIIFHARGNSEKPCDLIVAGAATAAFLKLRHGVCAASRSAVIGGATIALFQGLSIFFDRRAASEVKYVFGKGFPVKEPKLPSLPEYQCEQVTKHKDYYRINKINYL